MDGRVMNKERIAAAIELASCTHQRILTQHDLLNLLKSIKFIEKASIDYNMALTCIVKISVSNDVKMHSGFICEELKKHNYHKFSPYTLVYFTYENKPPKKHHHRRIKLQMSS